MFLWIPHIVRHLQRALRVFRAVTRLTVYRRLSVLVGLWIYGFGIIHRIKNGIKKTHWSPTTSQAVLPVTAAVAVALEEAKVSATEVAVSATEAAVSATGAAVSATTPVLSEAAKGFHDAIWHSPPADWANIVKYKAESVLLDLRACFNSWAYLLLSKDTVSSCSSEAIIIIIWYLVIN